jgi:hypothetical protein
MKKIINLIIKILLILIKIIGMKNKFNRLDEISFVFKGQKLFGIIKSFEQVILENDITYSYEIFLIQPITISNITLNDIRVFENELSLEKFPLDLANKSNIAIII